MLARWILLLTSSFFGIHGVAQDSLQTFESGFAAKGLYSEFKLIKFKSLGSLKGEASNITLSSNPEIFYMTEPLREVSAHWNSGTMVLEIRGNDHDYFILTIQILKETFRAKFSWDSDHIESKILVKPTSANLQLNTRDLKKDNVVLGKIHFEANSVDEDYGKTRHIKLKGKFKFVVP